jgi:prephenate dehydratase
MTTPITLAYLGPAGTFTEEAARQYRSDATLVSCSTIPAIAKAVLGGSAEQGVFPIENSLQGAVTDTLDLLIHGDGLRITQEIAIPISHCLVMKPGTDLRSIATVYSHPQALAQCREYLERKFPKAAVAASLSTAAAVDQALSSPTPAAAISNRRAAELTGAEVVEEGVQDNLNNVTRFVVLAGEDHAPTGRDKTSICFSFAADKPGQLYWAMGEFAERNVNLSKIESRPTRMGLGQYYFLVDMEGHREDAKIKDALTNLGKAASLLKVFGSYPRYTLPS